MMNLTELRAALKSGIVSLTFVKKNGEHRDMNCTLNSDIISAEYTSSKGSEKKEKPEDFLVVWDCDKGAFRSFWFDQIVSVNA